MGRRPGVGRVSLHWPNGGVWSTDRRDRIQDIEPIAIAPDYPGRTVIRAGRVLVMEMILARGFSGGPLINDDGELVGISCGINDDFTLGVDVSEVKKFLLLVKWLEIK